MDRRLLEFCLALPPNLKVRNGYHRYPARRVLDGVLPPSIQWRTTKTLFSPDYNLRYNAQLHMAQDFVASIGRKDPVRSIVDLDELTRIMKPVNPLKYDADALGLIPSTLYMVCFLRQFSEFRV